MVLQREENTTTNVRIRYVFPNQDRVFYIRIDVQNQDRVFYTRIGCSMAEKGVLNQDRWYKYHYIFVQKACSSPKGLIS